MTRVSVPDGDLLVPECWTVWTYRGITYRRTDDEKALEVVAITEVQDTADRNVLYARIFIGRECGLCLQIGRRGVW